MCEHAPLVAVGAAHRRRTDALLARPFVDIRFRHEELIDIHVLRFVLGIRDGRVQNLLDRRRNPFIDRAQNVDGVAHLLAANHVDDQPCLLRRDPYVAGFGFRQTIGVVRHDYFAAFSVDLAAWPLKVRVGENSPSLCPTMFSVT